MHDKTVSMQEYLQDAINDLNSVLESLEQFNIDLERELEKL